MHTRPYIRECARECTYTIGVNDGVTNVACGTDKLFCLVSLNTQELTERAGEWLEEREGRNPLPIEIAVSRGKRRD